MTIHNTDLLILGDSFCAERVRNIAWPVIVKNSLSANLRGQGFPGASWWSVRNQFIQEIKAPPKIAIFCHTEPNRIPHEHDWGINTTTAELGLVPIHYTYDDQPMPAEFQLACKLYYKHLWYQEYQNWAMTRWLCELDELTKDIEIVLHFFGFDDIHRHHRFHHGVSFSDPLMNYATMALDFNIRNHFDIDTNQRFADVVLEHIHNYPGAGVRIDKKLDLR
jgi:hypothetical protein